jgi:hypothetical protein
VPDAVNNLAEVASRGRRDSGKKTGGNGVLLIFFVLSAHVALAIVMKSAPIVGAIHAFAVLAGGMIAGFASKKSLYPAMAASYIAGSEVLWRMAKAPIFWEFGKYSVVIVLLIGLFRYGSWRRSGVPMLYFALLVPAAFLTITEYPWDVASGMLSFNLSGPLSLCISVIFFLQCRFSLDEVGRIVLALVTPIIGVSALILLRMSDAPIAFGTSSNAAASGGFGPNQVSTTLAVGAVGIFLVLIVLKQSTFRKILFGSLFLLFAAQSVLTFSRAGLYYGVTAITASSLFVARNGKQRIQLLIAVAIVCCLGYFLLFPRMDEFTGGALTKRYADRHLTGRDEIMSADIQIFLRHMALGIGVGQAEEYRLEYYGSTPAAHTEYTRLLAEHGIFGLLAAILMISMGLAGIPEARGPANKAIVAALAVFGLMYMTGNGMRVVLPSLLLGLGRMRISEPRVSATQEKPVSASTLNHLSHGN